MKVVSSNVNGLESARKYGFFDWLTWRGADIVCLQELNVSKVPGWFTSWAHGAEYEVALSPCLDGGNGGTAILSRYGFANIEPPVGVLERRGQSTCVAIGSLSLCSVYVTLNNVEEERQALQMLFDSMAARHDLALICGDFNIIGTNIDADTVYGSSALGCKPGERAWLAGVLRGWVNVLPKCCNERPLRTFWVRNKARFEANLGTRIDYQLASPALAKRVRRDSGSIFRDYWHGVRITDHGPITVEYDVEPSSEGLSREPDSVA